MKNLLSLLLAPATLLAATAHALSLLRHQQKNSFAGVNSFFLHAFEKADRLNVLNAIQAANLRVLRIFISETFENFKNTGSRYMPDIEPEAVGDWDDTQLEAVDQLMVEAHERDCGQRSASDNNVEFWYSDANCISDFENRISHILEHRSTTISGSPAWKDLSSHIFSFNIQNEGQGNLNNNIAPHPSWWCDRAIFIRGILGKSEILISTGGGNEFPNSDVPENWACTALDLVNIHSYSGVNEFRDKGPAALRHAIDADKLMLFEEFGASGDSKASEVAEHIAVFNDLRVPWLPWQISKPGNGEANFEFWTDEEIYRVVQEGSSWAAELEAAQSWPI